MTYREPFSDNEWYHCYSRGVEKRRIFESAADYQRFMQALYLCNDTRPMTAHSTRLDHREIFSRARRRQLVSIGAYCLMPNHFHLLLFQRIEGGITSFMRKLGTAYTMYFNKKNDRVGNLLVKPFRSKHIANDDYLRQVVKYIHLNPAELFERGWKSGLIENIDVLEKHIENYRYSSLHHFTKWHRTERSIIDREAMESFFDDMPDINRLLSEAAAYYAELPR